MSTHFFFFFFELPVFRTTNAFGSSAANLFGSEGLEFFFFIVYTYISV